MLTAAPYTQLHQMQQFEQTSTKEVYCRTEDIDNQRNSNDSKWQNPNWQIYAIAKRSLKQAAISKNHAMLCLTGSDIVLASIPPCPSM